MGSQGCLAERKGGPGSRSVAGGLGFATDPRSTHSEDVDLRGEADSMAWPGGPPRQKTRIEE